MNRTRCRWGLGPAGLLAAVFLGLPQSAQAQGKGKFTDGLENAIDQIVHLIGMGVQQDLPRNDVRGLDHALRQLLRVFEDGPPGPHKHGHHHHGHGLGMGARQAGGDAGNQKGLAQDKGSRGRFDQGAKCLCECMNPGAGNKRQINNPPADPKAGQAAGPNNLAKNQQPGNAKPGQPVAGKAGGGNQGIKMEPGMAYLMGKPHAAKQQGPNNATPPATAKKVPTPAQQPLAKTAGHISVAKGNGQPFASVSKHTASRSTNSAPMQRQSRARVGANRQMLSSPWTLAKR